MALRARSKKAPPDLTFCHLGIYSDASRSRGALLEGAREAERDAAPARVVRTHSVREAGVIVRANYVALPL